MRAIKSRKEKTLFSLVLAVNLVLFAVKLYVGLSSNSISIYSDGINNLLDSFSSLAGLVFFSLALKNADMTLRSSAEKGEQLLSFVMSVVLTGTGLVFLYNSAERLMYPTPVWFSMRYLYLLALTAAAKLVLFFLLKRRSKDSDVIRVTALDSLTDFFITSVTVVTLYASHKGSFSFDALAGIGISVFILLTGMKNLKHSVALLLSFPDAETRTRVAEIIKEHGLSSSVSADFSFKKEKRLYLETESEITQEKLEKLKQRIYEETELTLYLLK